MADIVLKDRDGNPVTHKGVETVRMVNTDGEAVDFVNAADVPALLENVPIEPDFSNGNQYFSAPAGMAVKSAIVQKPENLIPDNVAAGVNIAGIVGTLVAGSSNIVVSTGTVSGANMQSGTFTHNLGYEPDILLMFPIASGVAGANYSSKIISLVYMSPTFAEMHGIKNSDGTPRIGSYVQGSYKNAYAYPLDPDKVAVTETNITLPIGFGLIEFCYVAIGGLI